MKESIAQWQERLDREGRAELQEAEIAGEMASLTTRVYRVSG